MATTILNQKSIHESITFEEATQEKSVLGWIEANYDYWNVFRRFELRKMPLDIQQEAALKWLNQCIADRPWTWVKSHKKQFEILNQILDPIRDINSLTETDLSKNPLPWFRENIKKYTDRDASSDADESGQDSWLRRMADVALEKGEYLLTMKLVDNLNTTSDWVWGYLQKGEKDKIKPLFSKPLCDESYSLKEVIHDSDVLEMMLDSWGLDPKLMSYQQFSEDLLDLNAPMYVKASWLDWCLKNGEKEAAERMRGIFSEIRRDDLQNLIEKWSNRLQDEYPAWTISFFEEAVSSPLLKRTFIKEILETEMYSEDDSCMLLWALRKSPVATELSSYENFKKFFKHNYEDQDFDRIHRRIKSHFEKESLSKLPQAKAKQNKTPIKRL